MSVFRKVKTLTLGRKKQISCTFFAEFLLVLSRIATRRATSCITTRPIAENVLSFLREVTRRNAVYVSLLILNQ